MNSLFAPNHLGWEVSQGSPSLMTCPSTTVGNGFARLGLLVDWARGEICHHGGRRCKLSARETALLACLARKAGTPVSRDEILSQVWQLDPRRTRTRTIDMHISHLRRKLDDAEGSRVLITVQGVGYMLRRGAISSGTVPPPTGKVTTGIESLSTL